MRSEQLIYVIFMILIILLVLSGYQMQERYIGHQCNQAQGQSQGQSQGQGQSQCQGQEIGDNRFHTLIDQFNCLEMGVLSHVIDHHNTFTLSAWMSVNKPVEGSMARRVFNFQQANVGVWINSTHLLIGTSNSRTNVKLSPSRKNYHLVVVNFGHQAKIYLDGEIIQMINIGEFGKNINIGRQSGQPGADISLTLAYLSKTLDDSEVRQCWLKTEEKKAIERVALEEEEHVYKPKKQQCPPCQAPTNELCPGEQVIYLQADNGHYLTADKPMDTLKWGPHQPANSCFRLVSPIFPGPHPPNSYSLESIGFPGNYCRHAGFVLRLEPPSSRSQNQHLKEDFIFQVVPGLTGQPNTITLKAVQAAFGGGCFYRDGPLLRFQSSHCPSDPVFNTLATLIIGKPSPVKSQCRAPQVIVKDFDCRQTKQMPGAWKLSDKMTFPLQISLSDYGRGWQHIFHAGDQSARRRTPGVWINDGFLHIRASNQIEWNDGDGCWRIQPRLSLNQIYQLVLVYSQKSILVYLDSKLVVNCPTKAAIVPENNLYLGKLEPFTTASAHLSLGYYDEAFDSEQVVKCWSDMHRDLKLSVIGLSRGPQVIIKDFDCRQAKQIPGAWRLSDKMTFPLQIYLSDYGRGPNWQHLFHAGDQTARRRTPGVWINDGFLHVRASNQLNWNDGEGCWKINPRLSLNRIYQLVLVYNQTSITVYVDSKLVANCSTKAVIVPENNLYLGDLRPFATAYVRMSLGYYDEAFDSEQVIQRWSEMHRDIQLSLV